MLRTTPPSTAPEARRASSACGHYDACPPPLLRSGGCASASAAGRVLQALELTALAASPRGPDHWGTPEDYCGPRGFTLD